MHQFYSINSSNRKNDLILKTDAKNEYWSAMLKINEGEKLCKYSNGGFKKVKCNYPMIKKISNN